MITDNVMGFIPQREPFIMVNSILDVNKQIGHTSFTIQEDNILAEHGYFTESGLIENIAQSVAACSGYNNQAENRPVLTGYIAAVSKLKVYELPQENKQIITEVELINEIFNITLIAGKVFCDNRLLASCEMKIFHNQS